MIELRHITKSYNGLTVLTDINMTFRDGGCYCLMGPSGSGKTTLMRILMGLETPDEGTVAGKPGPEIRRHISRIPGGQAV